MIHTDEQVETAARAFFKAGAENAARELGLTKPVEWDDLAPNDKEHARIQARAVLVAVGPSIAAQALRAAAEAIPGSNTPREVDRIDEYVRCAEWMIDRADQIEQEAR